VESHRRTERDSVLVAGEIDYQPAVPANVTKVRPGRVEGGKHDPGRALPLEPAAACTGTCPSGRTFLLERRSQTLPERLMANHVGTLEGGPLPSSAAHNSKAPMGANIGARLKYHPERRVTMRDPRRYGAQPKGRRWKAH